MAEIQPQVTDPTLPIRAENIEVRPTPAAEVPEMPAPTPEQLRAQEVYFDQEDAIRLVVQDRKRAEDYIGQKWGLWWREDDILYQSPRSLSAMSDPRFANISRYTVLRLVQSTVPVWLGALFYDADIFEPRPNPNYDQQLMRGKKALFRPWLDAEFRSQIKLGGESMANFGTGFWIWGEETCNEDDIVLRKKTDALTTTGTVASTTVHTTASDEWEWKPITRTVWKPWFQRIDHRYVLPDPNWDEPDIRKAKWVCIVKYLDFYELDALRGNPHYDIPEPDVLKSWFEDPAEQPMTPGLAETASTTGSAIPVHAERRFMDSSADPLLRKLMVTERVSKKLIFTVVQDRWLIRGPHCGKTCGKNPFNVINLYSANLWNVFDSGFGIGIGRVNGQDQRIETGVTNAALTLLSFIVNADYLAARGANVPTQPIRSALGRIIKTDIDPANLRNAIVLKELPKVDPALFAVLQQTKSEEEATSGASEPFAQGTASRAGSSVMRTATGAGRVAAAVGTRQQTPIDTIVDNVIVPWIYQLDWLTKRYMPGAQAREVLDKELAEGQRVDAFKCVDARFEYQVLAGAKLAIRQSMAQSLPLLIQLIEAPNYLEQLATINQMTLDPMEVARRFNEGGGSTDTHSLFIPLTPQQIQNHQQSNPVMAKAKMAAAQQQQKHADDQENIESKSVARAGEHTLAFLLEKSMEPYELSGNANPAEIGGGV